MNKDSWQAKTQTKLYLTRSWRCFVMEQNHKLSHLRACLYTCSFKSSENFFSFWPRALRISLLGGEGGRGGGWGKRERETLLFLPPSQQTNTQCPWFWLISATTTFTNMIIKFVSVEFICYNVPQLKAGFWMWAYSCNKFLPWSVY